MRRFEIEYTDGTKKYFDRDDVGEFIWMFRMEGDHALTYRELPKWVVCAACRNTENGYIAAGARHFDKVMKTQIEAMCPPDTDMMDHWSFGWSGADQGFIDQWGFYLTREEAAEIAYKNGQTETRLTILFSEDLY